ncbi:MAG: tetratricopeptide repeat protein [Nitrospirae bacterium YQR-1]
MDDTCTYNPKPEWINVFTYAVLIVALTLSVFWNTKNAQFLIYDDNRYVTGNPYVQMGITKESILWAFTTDNDGNWFPLTWLTHLVDFEIYGLRPAGHHITNLVIHTVNSLLVFMLFTVLLKRTLQGAVIGALFAIHPMHVESVAWVSERKDVLCAFWFFTTLLCYVSWVRTRGIFRYMLTVVSFAFALMSKPMAVTIPVVLLFFDFWPHGRLTNAPSAETVKRLLRLTMEKIPFIILSAASCVITVYVQKTGGHLMSSQRFLLPLRVENAVLSYVKYLYFAVWPTGLSNFYPMPESIPLPSAVISAFIIVGITTVALLKAKTKPWFIFGWLWFFVTLLPVIGLIQVELQAMANRYTYIPYIGLFVIAVVCVFEITEGFPKLKLPLSILAALSILLLSYAARIEVSYWTDSLSLTYRAIEVNSKNYMAYYNLGYIKASEGKHEEALISYKKAVVLKPDFGKPYINAGYELLALQRIDEAVRYFKKSIPVAGPNISRAFNGLGIALLEDGKIAEAHDAFQSALKHDPGMQEAQINLDTVNEMMGRIK